MDKTDILERIAAILEERKSADAETSYVASLYAGGQTAIAAKVSEEAAELIEAAGKGERAHIIHEAADLLFHCQVLLADQDISIEEVLAELERRFGVSGHDEKRQR